MNAEKRPTIIVSRTLVDMILCGDQLSVGEKLVACESCRTPVVLSAAGQARLSAPDVGRTLIFCMACGDHALDLVESVLRVEATPNAIAAMEMGSGKALLSKALAKADAK